MSRRGSFFLIGALLCIMKAAGGAERYAFLVGVKQYDKTQLNDLRFSENDVTGLATALESAGYPKRNIVLMTQTLGAADARLAPFAKSIQRELALVLREAKPADTVLVALSGHGVQLANDPESYFCPADANVQDRSTLVPLGAVYQSLQACKAAVKVLLVDACRNDPLSNLSKSRPVVDLETLSNKRPLDPPGGIAAFFSCSKGEQSFEHPSLKHGIFFHFVIEGLSGTADFDKDQQISLAELELYAVKEVQSYSRIELGTAQTPERRGEVRGLLILASLSDVRASRVDTPRRIDSKPADISSLLSDFPAPPRSSGRASDSPGTSTSRPGQNTPQLGREEPIIQNEPDKLVIVSSTAQIKDGESVIATARKGQVYDIKDTNGAWYQVEFMSNGLTRFGWIHRDQVTRQETVVQRKALPDGKNTDKLGR